MMINHQSKKSALHFEEEEEVQTKGRGYGGRQPIIFHRPRINFIVPKSNQTNEIKANSHHPDQCKHH